MFQRPEKNNQLNKVLAIALCVCVFVTILFFLNYEAANEIHDCTGNDCPICHELQIASGFIKQFSTVGVFMATGFFCAVFLRVNTVLFHCLTQARTLIADKVRLDH